MRNLALALALILSGCAYKVNVRNHAGVIFPPTTTIRLYHFPPPEPFTEFATLEVDDSDRESEKALLTKGRALGADGVILLPGNGSRTQGVAIKFIGDVGRQPRD